MQKSFEELIKDETKKRLEQIHSDSYQFPPKANKFDYIGILALMLICLLLIALCMVGIIQ